MKRIITPLFFLLISGVQFLYGQNGYIRGTVFDDVTGESLPGVTIYAEESGAGTITDLDGKFSLSISSGINNIRISYISYETITISDVEVSADNVADLGEIRLKESVLELNEVVVTSKQIRNTETALISIKKRSPNILDGISAGSLKLIGDSDAADAVKRVTGVSVAQGKYVYVRGLGDRYTKTILNGMDIPGLDPDRNAIQMDIFPTNVVNNIIVHKTFSAELPADFTGGAVNIELKDFPTRKETSFSISTGYNPGAHFNSSYLSYEGGKLDFLGIDDGSRKIPAKDDIPMFAEVIGNPTGERAQLYSEILESFSPIMAAQEKMSLPNMSLSFSHGNQKTLDSRTLGYHFSLSYKNNTEFYVNAESGKYGLSGTNYEMDRREYQIGSYGENNVLLSALTGVALKTLNSKVRLNLLHLQSGSKKAGIFDFEGSDQGSDFSAFQHNLDYSQRSLTNMIIDGKHRVNDGIWELEWKVSPTLSVLRDPDIRFTRYQVTADNNLRIGTEVGFPERIWRNLNEVNSTGLMHATRKFSINGRDSKLHFGGLFAFKNRNYIIRNFAINPRGDLDLTGNPDELFQHDNLWPYYGSIGEGITYETPFVPNNPNQFRASVYSSAVYVSGVFALTSRFKVIAGLRLESFIQKYTGSDQQKTHVLRNETVLNDIDPFPTVNLLYHLTDNQNLRFSYTQTIARPSFKELSYAEIYDPISGNTFIGGFHQDADDVSGLVYWDGDLKSTDIKNLDLRWEYFMDRGQMLSFSGFYKTFENPIEMVQYVKQIGAFQPRNVGNGTVYGLELELRKNFDFISESLSGLKLSGNFTLTRSAIEMSKTEYQSRVENARSGQVIETTRDMAGQAPYMVNAGLSYKGQTEKSERLQFGIFYNVQGTTLEFVGVADRPDIYTNPFHSLNFNSSYSLGKQNQWNLGFRITNLLDEDRELVYKSYNASDQFFERRKPGMTFTLSASYRIVPGD